MQTPDKKFFCDMQEHPEKYSDQEIEAMMDDLDQMPDVDMAWQEFNHQHTAICKPRRWLQIAAMFTGVVFFSGIAYAALYVVRHIVNVEGDLKTPTEETRIIKPHQEPAEADTMAVPQPKLYDNVPLGEIFKELSGYYNVKVVYQNENAPRLRLFYQWKPEYRLEKVVEMLNNFEWIQIEVENDTLFIRTTAIPAKDC